MGYKPKAVGDKLNAQQAAAYAAPRKTTCPWCSMAGRGYHTLTLSADGQTLFCPQCQDARPATDADRRVYGGGA